MNELELERRVRDLFRTGPVPTPSEQQMQTILARRLAGERMTLPLDPSTLDRRLVRSLLVTAAAACILLLVPIVCSRNPGSGQDEATPGGRENLVNSLYAQASDHPTFPIIRATRPLPRGSWRYALVDEDSPGDTASAWRQDLSTARYEGQERYVWYYGKGGRLTDTLWLDQESLRPVARVSATAVGTQVTQIFQDASVLNGVRTAAGMTEWRSVPLDSLGPRLIGGGRLQADFYDTPGVIALWRPQLAATLGAAELAIGWRGSMEAISAPMGMAIHFWLNLEVVGEDTVTVPAGRFATWKLQVGKQPGYYAWVSKDRQWLVQLGTANGGGGERQVLLQGRENDR